MRFVGAVTKRIEFKCVCANSALESGALVCASPIRTLRVQDDPQDVHLDELQIDDLPGDAGSRKLLTNILGGWSNACAARLKEYEYARALPINCLAFIRPLTGWAAPMEWKGSSGVRYHGAHSLTMAREEERTGRQYTPAMSGGYFLTRWPQCTCRPSYSVLHVCAYWSRVCMFE
jgi:hypothetical protein